MAIMWPREIPSWVAEDERRSAEVRVFKKLEEVLDNSWIIYYSRPWWGLNLSGGEIDGEADFIISHSENGMLFLEVKGGRISYEPESSNWYSTDRLNIRHRIKNPVEQAKTCRYRFFEKLKDQKSWPKDRIRMRYGVIFTDTVAPTDSVYLGGYEPSLFCHAEKFDNDLLNWINVRVAGKSNESEIGLGQAGLAVLQNLVAGPVNLSLTLQRESESEIQQMNSLLTGAQLQILAEVVEERTLIIEGGAGTGKTVIATEMAIRLSEIKHSIYFVAVGSALLANIKIKLSVFVNIKVMTEQEFISNQVKNIIGTNDVLIIDEAQDFNNNFWNNIEQYKIEKNFDLYVFMDSNQSVYRSPEDIASRLQAKRMTLRLNLRNTQSISKLTSNLYSGPVMYTYGPIGTKPEIQIENDLDRAVERVLRLILQLIRQEGVRMSSIAVLSKNSGILDRLKPGLLANRILFSPADKYAIESITLDTVSRFKGMESPFVILFADRELSDHEELSYVATSRARSHLYIIGNIEGTLLRAALDKIS
jgi:hypothetical protein